MSQDSLESPMDLLRFQLRSTLSMEEDSLAALQDLEKAAPSGDVQQLFRHHADETREQIDNLHKVFELFEFPASTAGSPATKGISQQAHSMIERSATALRDQVALTAAMGNEHYEISVYQSLLVASKAQGATEATALLTANLDQETHTSEELHSKLQQIAC